MALAANDPLAYDACIRGRKGIGRSGRGRTMAYRSWSWFTGTIIFSALIVLFLIACGPEGSRTRDGGEGGSSRPAAPPTVVSEPSLVVKPTMNIPYATPGALPTLRPAPASASPGNPVTTPNPTPIASPTR